jgi:hypothetical protein
LSHDELRAAHRQRKAVRAAKRAALAKEGSAAELEEPEESVAGMEATQAAGGHRSGEAKERLPGEDNLSHGELRAAHRERKAARAAKRQALAKEGSAAELAEPEESVAAMEGTQKAGGHRAGEAKERLPGEGDMSHDERRAAHRERKAARAAKRQALGKASSAVELAEEPVELLEVVAAGGAAAQHAHGTHGGTARARAPATAKSGVFDVIDGDDDGDGRPGLDVKERHVVVPDGSISGRAPVHRGMSGTMNMELMQSTGK